MILVDANLLLYACCADLPEHERARAWLEARFCEPSRVGLPWNCLLAFVRISTHPGAFRRPLATDRAWKQVAEWLALPNAWVPLPTPHHGEILGQLILATRATGSLVMDAHLAALSLEHGLIVQSRDTDFGRFPGVRWEDPLRSA